MLRQLTAIAALVATAVSVGDATQFHLKVVEETTPDKTTTDTTATASTTNNANTWHMKPVKSVQARVQGDMPVYDTTANVWVSKYGNNLAERYRASLDTANTASVEGALMYVQAEGINVNEQSVTCQRKNNMQYVVFYELTIVQPTYAIDASQDHIPPEYTAFLSMDSGKCTDEGTSLPKACKQLYGLDGELALGASVGAETKVSDPRAPYPGNYWFSFPNSCADQLRGANKTDACRAAHAGGLCPVGKQPDGETCSFAYTILGFINLDDLVGITALKSNTTGANYKTFGEFCKDGGVEFDAVNTIDKGFTVKESLPFWENPGDEAANAKRAAAMVKMYNEMVPKTAATPTTATANATGGPMTALPTVADLVNLNPKCYENSKACATAKNGCKRTLLAQICEVCTAPGDDCEVAPSTFTYPTLVSATLAPGVTSAPNSTVAPTSGSTTGSTAGSKTGTAGSKSGTSGSKSGTTSGAASTRATFATTFASVAIAVGVTAAALI